MKSLQWHAGGGNLQEVIYNGEVKYSGQIFTEARNTFDAMRKLSYEAKGGAVVWKIGKKKHKEYRGAQRRNRPESHKYDTILKLARSLALAHVNENRDKSGYLPLKRLEPPWWQAYGEEWMLKAEQQIAKEKSNADQRQANSE